MSTEATNSRQRMECGRESDELPLSMTDDPEKLQQAGALHTLARNSGALWDFRIAAACQLLTGT